ncbi:MAG: DUF1911 domain-containing protein [Hymenobacter sp.]|nr:MAG: DUF1911 domain-containing protein [Hymenobacter sp.]
MTKREPLLSELYFDEHLAFVTQAITEYEETVRLDPGQFTDLAGVYYALGQYRLLLFISSYSRGYAVADLQQNLHALIATWERQRQADVANVYNADFKDDISGYEQALWVLTWTYLLGLGEAATQRLLACIGNAGQDILFERLVAKILPGTVRKEAKKLLYPKVYQPLLAATEADPAQQQALLPSFLQQWYGKMRNADWHNAHLGPDGGGFDGYWC